MTDKVNIEETNTVWAQSLPKAILWDAVPWADVILSNSYNKCYEWMLVWISTTNKCRATGHRKYAFPDPRVIVCVFLMLCYVLPPLTELYTFVFSQYEQVYRTRKVCISRPMFIGLFSLVLVGTTTSQNIRHFFNILYTVGIRFSNSKSNQMESI